ncbi:MAG: periplasmic protein TonB [Thermoanaerobaculia bacterium]|nr:periplasmic protein TonB [Thermoanaerobaculia bacterium]
MFETSVIRAEVVGERRARMITMSFGFHGLVVIAIFAASIRSVDFPTSSPREYAIPILTKPLSIPPALGTPNGGHKQATPPAPTKQKTSIPMANLAPATLPDHTEPAAATSTGETTATGTDTGSEGPQGVPWGVKDGVGDGPPATNTAAVENDVPLPVGGEVKAPVVIRRFMPPYPRTALAMHLNGSVIVECIIDKMGRVRDARVVSSTSPLFNQTAIDAVLQWQFAPGSLHGKAIDTIFDLTVTFRVTA